MIGVFKLGKAGKTFYFHFLIGKNIVYSCWIIFKLIGLTKTKSIVSAVMHRAL